MELINIILCTCILAKCETVQLHEVHLCFNLCYYTYISLILHDELVHIKGHSNFGHGWYRVKIFLPPIKLFYFDLKSIVFVVVYHFCMYSRVEHHFLGNTAHIDLKAKKNPMKCKEGRTHYYCNSCYNYSIFFLIM